MIIISKQFELMWNSCRNEDAGGVTDLRLQGLISCSSQTQNLQAGKGMFLKNCYWIHPSFSGGEVP